MDTNIVRDITDIYFEHIVESSHLETDMKKRRKDNEKAVEDMKKTKAHRDMAAAAAKKFDEALDPVGKEDDDVDNDGKKNTKSDKYLLNRRKAVGKAIATQEAKEVKRWWDDDGDGKGYEEGEVSGKFKKKKKIKEGFSNWREDLIEVADKIGKNKSEEPKIVEKAVNNKIDINPKLDLGEVAQNLGGSLLEMTKIEDFEGVLDELTESEMFLLKDDFIEKIVQEVFVECIEEGYNLFDIENTLLESLEISSFILSEETDINTTIKEGRLEKVKSAVKSVAKGLARGVGYAAGAAVRAVKGAGREMKSGYERGRQGSSSSGSSESGESGESKESGETKKPGLLSRIGSKLKKGLKKVIAKGARAVSRGARNVARKAEGGETKKAEAPKAAPKKAEKAEDPWAGSATTPPKTKSKTKKPAAPKAAAKTPAKKKRTSKLDSLLASVRSEEVQIDEKTLTDKETSEKERLVKSMKSKASDFEKRYPGRGKEVMYATATKMAKKMAEQFDN
jgi:hypothetical protein